MCLSNYHDVNFKYFIILDANYNLIKPKVKRGVTRFPAYGVFGQKERNVLLCIVSKKQIPEVKEIVLEIDEKSFLVVGDVREVMGEGFVQKLQ